MRSETIKHDEARGQRSADPWRRGALRPVFACANLNARFSPNFAGRRRPACAAPSNIAVRASFEQAGAAALARHLARRPFGSGVTAIQPVAELIETTRQEYHAAMRRSLAQIEAQG